MRETMMIRVVLPFHLRTLAGVEGGEVLVEVREFTQRGVIDGLEEKYPMLRGTMRDHGSEKRRAMIRFYAGGEDLSHELPGAPLPEGVVSGREAFLVVGAISGG